MKYTDLSEMARHYLVAALWSSTDSKGNPLDNVYALANCHSATLERAQADCDAFQAKAGDLLALAFDREGYDQANAGHDFWLTRNGHGAGFWDRRELEADDLGDKLTAICKAFKEQDIYAHKGRIYISGAEPLRILTTQAQLKKHKHGRPNFAFRCGCCRAVVPLPYGDTCATGYGYTSRDPKARPECYPCLDAKQREELKDRSKPFVAYVSSDGQRITTWTGGELMRVTQSWSVELTRQSYTHDRRGYKHFRCTDCHGKRWHGCGSAGIAIRLRPCK